MMKPKNPFSKMKPISLGKTIFSVGNHIWGEGMNESVRYILKELRRVDIIADTKEDVAEDVFSALSVIVSKIEGLKKEVYIPTDEQVGNGAYYELREIKGFNAAIDKVVEMMREK